MYNLVNTNFSRTYNPIGNRNALSDIKRLLTSRDTVGQTKACGYVVEVVKRYHFNSEERAHMVYYLLENDIVVFLCEATSNLSFPLFRLVLECIRLLWNNRRFFSEEHAATVMAAVLRSLTHYSATDTAIAVDCCLHFLCDLFHGISTYEATPALSQQSPYSVEQLFACLHDLGLRICGNPKTILSGALVLDALISYQPNDIELRTPVVNKLYEVVNQWFDLLLGVMKHKLIEESTDFGMFLVVISQIGIDVLRLLKVLEAPKPTNFVQTILVDDQEMDTHRQCLAQLRDSVVRNISEIVVLVKENQEKMNNEEYSVFLKFLLTFLSDNPKASDALSEFCDILLTNGYLSMLPQYQILRNDKLVRKLSTLILGEMLKVLTKKYLITATDGKKYATDIQMGLVELQQGIERPDDIGVQLQKRQPYSLLIYIYFYCQTADKPEECTASLLPHLVSHVLSSPKSPPLYVVKALWLVFAMSTVSNGTTDSLDSRVMLEKATDRVVGMLQPDPSVLYTHHPAILLWAFTSLRIPYSLRLKVLSLWLTIENILPEDMSKEPMVWELLLHVLIHNPDEKTLSNCMDALRFCLDNDDSTRQDFANKAWSMLPGVLSRTLIDSDNVINPNLWYLLDIATSQLPSGLEQADCLKIAVLLTTLFSKSNRDCLEVEARSRYENASLKLCLMLLQISNEQNDDKVLLSYVNRAGFLPTVLTATESISDEVACSALHLLSYVVIYFTNNKYQAKTILQIQTDSIIKSLRQDVASERGVALLQLIYTVFSSAHTPLVFTDHIRVGPSQERQYNALQALLFRVQLILCCEYEDTQSPMGWKALNSIFKHAIVYKNDPKLVAMLSTQPWTFTLIRFQLTQTPTKEFVCFTHNWLTLLRITISKCRVTRSIYISKYSIIKRTLVMIKRGLKEEENEDCIKVVLITKEILNDCTSEKAIK